jgi:hypothetical protein
MWKAKLNQHFAKFAFLLWNLTFHSLWLSALFFLSSGNNFNSLWAENQIFFSTLSIGLFAFIFRDEWSNKLKDLGQARSLFILGFLQALVVVVFAVILGVLSKNIEFLGFSSQLGVNFLSSYSWVLRSIFLLILTFALNATTKTLSPHWVGLPLQLFFFWTWFQPTLLDWCFITLFYAMNTSLLFSTGLMGGFFIMTHAVFGSTLMGSEFSGLFQFKWIQDDTSLLHSPALILGLFFILSANKLKTILKRRKERSST